ncbi:MAG: ribosomal protein [Deltaproteobacteria bacterium]|jgi:large subunit ribosomal protein L9|nr:ribosomal protein [Deltaproteobacteria bacterium]
MKVILLEDVQGVGKTGEMKEVKDGFGRNFLIPRHLAMLGTQGNVKGLQARAKKLIDQKERVLKTAEVTKQKLEAASLTIKHRAGQDGKLFGSVTSKELAEAIKRELGLEFDRKSIRLDEPIKMTGAYTVDIHLEKAVSAQLKVEVEQE